MVMKLRSILDSPCGLRFFVEKLQISSSYSRQVLLDTPFTSTIKEIKENYSKLQLFYKQFISEDNFCYTIKNIQEKIAALRDIRGTLTRLEREIVLDDVELFEIKSLSLLNEEIRHIFKETCLNVGYLNFYDLSSVVTILDPEGHKINSFYVYEIYSEELRDIRKRLKKDEPYNEELYYESSLIEEKVRKELCNKLHPFLDSLKNTLGILADLDIIIAKSLQIKELDLVFPTISKGKNIYKGLFNPEVKELISKENRDFQNIDIVIDGYKPLLITGANMGGKSITLKTLALSQYLFQFSFGIPANNAEISSVSEILLLTGDHQSITKGLSSFAAEMVKIDTIIKSYRSGKRILALIDEPAGTTNPSEGTALVTALLKILTGMESMAVLTTHYNIDMQECNRLRVKGYNNGVMDYSLIPGNNMDVPKEALKIARSLGVDEKWINEAENLVNQKK